MTDPAPLPAAPESGKRLRCGEASRETLERLLGLEDAPEDCRVRVVVWYDDRLMVLLGPVGVVRNVLTLQQAAPGGQAWLRVGGLAISYNGVTVPEDIGGRVQRRAPERMAGHDLASLLGLIEEDPESAPLPANTAMMGQSVTNLLSTWAGGDAYAEFFAVGEIARSQLDSVDLSGSFRFVQHCDNECLMVTPHGVAPLIQSVEYPWDNRTRSLDLPTDANRVEPDIDSMATSELTENDVIMGNPARVRDVLDHMMATPNPEGKITFFSNTCVPIVTGEDVESVVRQYARISETPLVYLTCTPTSMYNVFRDLLHNRRLEAEAAAGAPDPASVNLVGYAEDSTTDGVRELLSAAGIRVNTHLIPEFSVARLQSLAGAPVSVMYPNHVWENHYVHLKDETRVRCMTPPAPYGWEGSRQWILEVGRALGREAEAERAWADVSARHEADWRAAKAEAAGHRVAIVIRSQEVHLLTDPSRTWGVPLLRMLEEAGFATEVFVKADDRKKAREVAEAIHGLWIDPSRHVLQAFNTFEMMRRRLRDSSAEAVLSYHFFDWRISEAGKNRFSLQIFEMGLPGAARTVRRLAGICRTPFYRRYRDWLARTAEGAPLRRRLGGADDPG